MHIYPFKVLSYLSSKERNTRERKRKWRAWLGRVKVW